VPNLQTDLYGARFKDN